VVNEVGEARLIMTESDPMQRPNEDVRALTRQVGELTHGMLVTDLRLTRIDGDIAELKADVKELKADVKELKTDVAETKGQLNRFEEATRIAFNRVDAQFERLFGLIRRDELGTDKQAGS
jgi:chromosome segregation ATPase